MCFMQRVRSQMRVCVFLRYERQQTVVQEELTKVARWEREAARTEMSKALYRERLQSCQEREKTKLLVNLSLSLHLLLFLALVLSLCLSFSVSLPLFYLVFPSVTSLSHLGEPRCVQAFWSNV